MNDFWRMIFEHKCPTIVMLTTLKEMGKVVYRRIFTSVKPQTRNIDVERLNHFIHFVHIHTSSTRFSLGWWRYFALHFLLSPYFSPLHFQINNCLPLLLPPLGTHFVLGRRGRTKQASLTPDFLCQKSSRFLIFIRKHLQFNISIKRKFSK